jgi:hypothetical protein
MDQTSFGGGQGPPPEWYPADVDRRLESISANHVKENILPHLDTEVNPSTPPA